MHKISPSLFLQCTFDSDSFPGRLYTDGYLLLIRLTFSNDELVMILVFLAIFYMESLFYPIKFVLSGKNAFSFVYEKNCWKI